MAIHVVLANRVEEVMRRWRASVRGTLTVESMPNLELSDALPTFVREVAAALREDEGLPAAHPNAERSTTAAGHGNQRLRLGFSLDSVVREYGALYHAIVTTLHDASGDLTAREHRVVFDTIIAGIAEAVTQYAHERDAVLVRQAKEHFAFVAHELRSPLSSSLMALQVLKQSGKLPSDPRTVGALERGLDRASTLIDETLTSARMASGVELRRHPTTLRSILEEVEADAIPPADAKGIALRVHVASDGSVDVDARLVRSAVSNLVRNAIKYSPKGTVEMRGNVASGSMSIEVEDCCGGLPPGHVEKAFAPFVRMDTAQSGFGLGLAIAKQAVDAHGGTIRVQNLPGKGCIFALEIPVEQGPH